MQSETTYQSSNPLNAQNMGEQFESLVLTINGGILSSFHLESSQGIFVCILVSIHIKCQCEIMSNDQGLTLSAMSSLASLQPGEHS